MRANAPVIRANVIRPIARPSSRRAGHDTKAFFYCVLAGLLLASYVHDPDGVEAVARKARTNIQQVASHMNPASFQAALVDLAKN